ncbi:MAG: hypothetical protein LBI02_04785, partial [Opitutaceae bacterium]|nr:hypothetical protein [Opitutaceae bacterium]
PFIHPVLFVFLRFCVSYSWLRGFRVSGVKKERKFKSGISRQGMMFRGLGWKLAFFKKPLAWPSGKNVTVSRPVERSSRHHYEAPGIPVAGQGERRGE